MAHRLHLLPGDVEEGVIDAYHRHAGGTGAAAGGHGVVVDGALRRGDTQQLRRFQVDGGFLLVDPQLLGEEDPLKIGLEPEVLQCRMAVRRDAGGQHGHPLAGSLAALQIGHYAGLHRNTGGIQVTGHLHPLRHDLLGGFRKTAVGFGKFRGAGKHRVCHAVIVFPGVGETPFCQKGGIHITPDAIGVDEGTVHVKNQHKSAPFLESSGGF